MSIFRRGAAAMIVGNAGSRATFATIANYLRAAASVCFRPPPMFQIPPVLLLSDTAMEKSLPVQR